MPFEIPEGWCWCTVGGIVYDLKYGTSKKSSALGDVPVLRMGNLTRKGTISYDNLVYTSDLSDIAEYELTKGDLLFNRTNSSDWVGKTALYDGKVKSIYAGYLVRVRAIIVNSEYLNIVMNSQYYRDWCFSVKTDAVNQSNINANKLASFSVPIPPLTEQNRIVREVMKMTELVEQIEQGVLDIQSFIGDVKAKILDLAIHGKLVPQDPNDEPASELLKRINPKAVASCDNPHYEQVPDGWCVCTLEDIIDYEQPQAYIVHSTDYSDSYKIPVLTAGKTFIIGYTNEQDGICDNVPVIIFDDFTTDSKYVDFSFKVKSSAMKILHVKDGINIKYVAYFMSVTRLIGDTHKRYWISEYSKVNIPLPPKAEQDRIVTQIEKLMCSLESIAETLV